MSEWSRLSRIFADEMTELLAGDRDGVDDSGRVQSYEEVLEVVRQANEAGKPVDFERAPAPLVDDARANEQQLRLGFLDDDRLVVWLADPVGGETAYVVNDDGARRAPAGLIGVGYGKAAFLEDDGTILVRRDFEGEVLARLAPPTGLEGVDEAFVDDVKNDLSSAHTCVHLAKADGCVVVERADGVYRHVGEGWVRLLPEPHSMNKGFVWSWKEYGDEEELRVRTEEPSVAVSPDGSWVAAVDLYSHLHVFDRTGAAVVTMHHNGDLPGAACFSEDSKRVLLSARYLSGGEGYLLQTSELPADVVREPWDDAHVVPVLENEGVLAAAPLGGGVVAGTSRGVLVALDAEGEERWLQYVGSSVTDVAVSPSGKKLATATWAAEVSIFDVDTGTQDPLVPGTSTNRELVRWLFWKTEKCPLRW